MVESQLDPSIVGPILVAGEDGPDFIRCVDGREPQIQKVWTFGEDSVTCEVHPTAQVDVGAEFLGELLTNYITENWCRILMFGVNLINGSVQWLGVPAPLRTDVNPYTDNILVPSPAWGTGGTATNTNWGSQPGGTYISVAVPWSGTVRVMTAYVHRIPENMCSAALRVYHNLPRDNRTERMQILSTS